MGEFQLPQLGMQEYESSQSLFLVATLLIHQILEPYQTHYQNLHSLFLVRLEDWVTTSP